MHACTPEKTETEQNRGTVLFLGKRNRPSKSNQKRTFEGYCTYTAGVRPLSLQPLNYQGRAGSWSGDGDNFFTLRSPRVANHTPRENVWCTFTVCFGPYSVYMQCKYKIAQELHRSEVISGILNFYCAYCTYLPHSFLLPTENPYPHLEVIAVKLNERIEWEGTGEGGEQEKGEGKKFMIETVFEMNYKTGLWRKLQYKRPV